MKPTIGIVTYDARGLPSTYKLDDKLLQDALSAKGAEAYIVSWRNVHIDWTSFDILVLRSCWDSHHHIHMYKKWLNDIKNSRARLVNHIDVVQWNFDKETYLDDLCRDVPVSSGRGIVIPSVFYTIHPQLIDRSPFQSAIGMTLKDILDSLDHSQQSDLWRGRDIVMKPTISGDGYRTFLIDCSGSHCHSDDIIILSEAETAFIRMLETKDLPGIIIQPLIAGIQDGEYSLVYIAGKLSHAILKRTDTGDFKNRDELNRMGIHSHELPDGMLDFADEIWRFIEHKFGLGKVSFARMDMIQEQDGTLILLELELVDPNLQFVRIPELYYSNNMHPTMSEIRQGENAMYRAIHKLAEAILASS